ncbi:hypothetical protein [Pontibacter sp. G13]|uniref:hypothetical protein n=1 Tax=Pontibacter sp. G13 TaxID=3074898 RepID=UPI002889514C|nr:hypothetical protein [Pontibacter sp. G13]WNJ17777.1 hypothetical protein RJD25_23235 [Pontibacter sp. G13]
MDKTNFQHALSINVKRFWGAAKAALACAILAFATVGCLDIEEEITLNADGSGKYQMAIDFSQMTAMIKSLSEGELDGEDSNPMIQAMDSTMEAESEKLRNMEGISNIAYRIVDEKTYMSYEFASIDALNNAMAKSQEEQGGGEAFEPIYQWKSGKLERKSLTPAGMGNLTDGEDEEGALAMMEMMFSDSKYKVTYHLPGKVKKTNGDGEVEVAGQTVVQEFGLMDLLKEETEAGISIKYKK